MANSGLFDNSVKVVLGGVFDPGQILGDPGSGPYSPSDFDCNKHKTLLYTGSTSFLILLMRCVCHNFKKINIPVFMKGRCVPVFMKGKCVLVFMKGKCVPVFMKKKCIYILLISF